MKLAYSSLVLALFPVRVARLMSWKLYRRVHPTARVGFSYIGGAAPALGPKVRIGHFNLVSVTTLELEEGARIGHLNRISGRFSVKLAARAAIGNRNSISRSRANGLGPSRMTLGLWSKITSGHRVNMADNFSMGEYSTVAGAGTQVWTHGYVHDETGIGRYRIDGPVQIGSNVYIGSMCFLSMGVRIADGIIVGGGTAVARDLLDKGLYVSAGIRCLPRPASPEERPDLERVGSEGGETVYRKIGAMRGHPA